MSYYQSKDDLLDECVDVFSEFSEVYEFSRRIGWLNTAHLQNFYYRMHGIRSLNRGTFIGAIANEMHEKSYNQGSLRRYLSGFTRDALLVLSSDADY